LHTGGTFQAQVGSNSTARSMLGLRGTAYVQRGSPKGKKEEECKVREHLSHEWEHYKLKIMELSRAWEMRPMNSQA